MRNVQMQKCVSRIRGFIGDMCDILSRKSCDKRVYLYLFRYLFLAAGIISCNRMRAEYAISKSFGESFRDKREHHMTRSSNPLVIDFPGSTEVLPFSIFCGIIRICGLALST